ncbi:hypothetical protein OESDEN_13820 [Oesophagostomum dentatum]|uniref:Uncharacterized protein n=1 Tax=Oesophagostomum dentatum TaxID=61180 RepID=A0A0B1SNA8_OESDE|nr:hypothetical protein OESDEN_13820 [Oesophagostomum dentatum]
MPVRLRARVQGWIDGSCPPSFPVMNSKGFKIALEKTISRMDTVIKSCPSAELNSEEPMEVGDSNLEVEEDEKLENALEEQTYEWTVVGERRKAT